MEGGIAAQTDGVDALNPEDAPAAQAEVVNRLAGARIRAAGGVVGRDGSGGTEVVLVHRPRFDDWSLPKGKLKRGEHPLAGAIREVEEETGISAWAGPRLPTARYDVWSGDSLAEKSVDYWAMTIDPSSGPTFTAGDEVDDIAWLPVTAAIARLSYPHDKLVLRHPHEPVVATGHRHIARGEDAVVVVMDQVVRDLDRERRRAAQVDAGRLRVGLVLAQVVRADDVADHGVAAEVTRGPVRQCRHVRVHDHAAVPVPVELVPRDGVVAHGV